MIRESATNTPEVTISKSIRVTGTGSIVANILRLEGSVRILEQYAVITAVTTLTNATGVYATLWDGTNSEDLTLDGAVLSGAPVDTMFLKDKVATQQYSVNVADQCRVNEVTDTKKAGKAFTITQKHDTDTFIRLHLTSTDNPVDFTVFVTFKYEPIMYNGSTLYFL